MHRLLSDDLWPSIAGLSRNHQRLLAAISYVTTADYLDFREGDVLVCDASDPAIKAGMTSAKTLRRFFEQGADIYSAAGLHAKTLVSDDIAVIGSANLSENAGTKTMEAALLTDDLRISALARGFIEQARRRSHRVDEAFLDRIGKIPVTRVSGQPVRKAKPIASSESRVWLVSTRPRSDKTPPEELAAEKTGMSQAKKKLRRGGYEIDDLRWSGRSRFRSEAQPGHLVIQVYREKRGSRTFTEVYRPVRIIHRHEAAKCTFFYIEVSADDDSFFRWSELKSELLRLGCKNVSPNSERELTGQSQRVLEWFLNP
jgi:PLD-like domain